MITAAFEETVATRYGRSKWLRAFRWLIFLALLTVISAVAVGVDLVTLFQDLPEASAKLGAFVPPDLTVLPELMQPALVTLLLALIPLPLGVALAIPVALAGSRNVAPSWLRLMSRTYITAQRNLPEIVLVLILVRAFGLGPFPGIVAIVLGSVGMLGKLIADAIEEVDEKTLESIAATGASHWQVIRYAIVPEVTPAIIANSLFRLEVNMRQAGLLGAVGAGGLGWELAYSLNLLEYQRVTTTFLVMLALVALVELVSDRLRWIIVGRGMQSG